MLRKRLLLHTSSQNLSKLQLDSSRTKSTSCSWRSRSVRHFRPRIWISATARLLLEAKAVFLCIWVEEEHRYLAVREQRQKDGVPSHSRLSISDCMQRLADLLPHQRRIQQLKDIRLERQFIRPRHMRIQRNSQMSSPEDDQFLFFPGGCWECCGPGFGSESEIPRRSHCLFMALFFESEISIMSSCHEIMKPPFQLGEKMESSQSLVYLYHFVLSLLPNST